MASALGLDFGTTNSVLALAQGTSTRSLFVEGPAGRFDTTRTALSFLKQQGHAPLKVEAGQAAIREFIDNPGECRFLQSIKTFAASALFQGTLVFAKRHEFEDLMYRFLARLRDYAGDDWNSALQRLVVGRPVQFAGASPDERLAIERYSRALARFDFPEIHYVYEPVAAAFYFARKLERDATVLVADFGGGTTDYSIIRFESRGGRLIATPIGHSGVGVAGDHFDFRIIDNIIAPLIGKGSLFKSFDKLLEVPSSYYANFGRWNQLSIFKTLKDFAELKKLVRTSLEPEKLEAFVDLVDHDEGYPLYQAVSATKIRLSQEDETEFFFAPLGERSRRSVRRQDFEAWIAPDLARIETALDEVLVTTSTAPAEIDRVFLTGGTSFVPAVRRLFDNRFGQERIESGGELLSIAHGLALIGEREDISAWTIAA
ncbi:molecular chaperone, Hsp70 family [Sinorhizobium fredii NGR234]|uniref:Molecular chaperone, Hsp70 family n=1 Tax=Sinorhizobium fredii (strain NBRC 101917 / NGR234) TaxID=394 RepID=C3M8P0_SINFN|nr:Hsp70 family protein [Sinorhizobium fredii]ACP24586.1 molecular chaperone, Hsp70 family [Sinorhizobium fredii NGR234]